jgi:hypothetical protein
MSDHKVPLSRGAGKQPPFWSKTEVLLGECAVNFPLSDKKGLSETPPAEHSIIKTILWTVFYFGGL